MKKYIDEVRKEASNGPFVADSIFSSHYIMDAETYAICSMTVGSECKRVNAALIAHCLNTHQTLLDALERLDNEYKDARSICGMLEMTCARDQALKAIEAASYVEVSE